MNKTTVVQMPEPFDYCSDCQGPIREGQHCYMTDEGPVCDGCAPAYALRYCVAMEIMDEVQDLRDEIV